MGYIRALEAAGATVHDNYRTDDWQGTWIAHVTYEGKTGFACGYFGSCEVCDSWQSFEEEHHDNGRNWLISREKRAEFGRGYLRHLDTLEDLKARYQEQASWDLEADSTLDWLNKLKA